MKAITGLVIGAFALTAVSATTPAPTHAQGMQKLMKEIEAKVENKKHAELIAKRRGAMRAMSGSMKQIVGYLKTNKGGPADVARNAARLSQIAKNLPDLFPAGTGLARYPGVTGAKPNIFENGKADFTKAAMTLASLADGLAKAASTSGAGKAEIGKAFGPVGKMGCGGCHKDYRQKLN
tara:strand:- start:177 stop:713 length:537 start_codon:yes stop_codon:yes gene_type:complete